MPNIIKRIFLGARSALSALFAGVLVGTGDYRNAYSFKTWTLGWVLRCLFEVTLYALLGKFIGSDEAVLFLSLGRILLVGAAEVVMCVQSSAWEFMENTLPANATTAAPLWALVAGRGMQWIPSAICVSILASLIIPVIFQLQIPLSTQIYVGVCCVVSAFSMYGFSFCVASIAVRYPSLRNPVGNATTYLIILFCGVIVPIKVWPTAVQAVAGIIPITHITQSIRDHIAGAVDLGFSFQSLGLAIVIGLVWFTLGAVLMQRSVQHAILK